MATKAPAAWPTLDLPLTSISHTGAPEWLVDRCDNVNPGNVDRCRYGDLTAPRTAVVVGDSMATSWLPAACGSRAGTPAGPTVSRRGRPS